MDQGALNSAVYDLQRNFGGIEEWAKIVNDSITDHATHLDKNNERFNVIRQAKPRSARTMSSSAKTWLRS